MEIGKIEGHTPLDESQRKLEPLTEEQLEEGDNLLELCDLTEQAGVEIPLDGFDKPMPLREAAARCAPHIEAMTLRGVPIEDIVESFGQKFHAAVEKAGQAQ